MQVGVPVRAGQRRGGGHLHRLKGGNPAQMGCVSGEE